MKQFLSLPTYRWSKSEHRGADGASPSIEMLHVETQEFDNEPRRYESMEQRESAVRKNWSTFPWKAIFAVSIVPLALAPIIVLAVVAEEASQNYIRGRDCYPNGLWKEAADATWEIMDSTYFFTPNLSFGAMTFTQVKVIDIAWDLLVGRGGQILLAWVNYRVLNEWLVYHMEMHLTSYKMYVALAFETTTMSTLGVLAKEFIAFGKPSWKRLFRWLAMFCMCFSTLYVLSFPTLMGAMTGYITTYESYVEDANRNLIEWGKVGEVVYVVEDAKRLGFEKPLVATRSDSVLRRVIVDYMQQLGKDSSSTSQDAIPNSRPDTTTFQADQPSQWRLNSGDQPIKLGAPSLNISSMQYGKPLRDVAGHHVQYYTIGDRQGDIYNSTYILSHSSCKPSETYQWGFSYIFLFMMSIFNFVWSTIMVCMWMDTRRSSRMYKHGRRPGLLRSIMELSAVIRQELGSGELEYLEEEELKGRLARSGGALLVPRNELRVVRVAADDVHLRRSWKRRLTRGSTF